MEIKAKFEKWQKVFIDNIKDKSMIEYIFGFFHQWGNQYEEFENIVGNYTTAIVELSDGSIVEIEPTQIVFIDK